MTEFSEYVLLSPFDGARANKGFFRLCTDSTKTHLNLYLVTSHDDTSTLRDSRNACMSPEQATALRDALMKAYPVMEKSKVAYEVQNKTGFGTAVIECRTVERLERTELAMFNRYSDAEAFAKMKNGS